MKPLLYALVAAGLLAGTSSALAVTVGHVDDFQDGTTQDWGAGFPHPDPPYNEADAGPTGAGDNALHVVANGGTGAGSRLAFYNQGGNWTGDYTAAGVTAIRADFKVLGTAPLALRVAFDGPGGRWASADAITLAADDAWHTLEFPVTAADLASAGGADVTTTLAGVNTVRILHNDSGPAWRGLAIDTDLLVDNVTVVPEPAAFALLALGVLVRRR